VLAEGLRPEGRRVFDSRSSRDLESKIPLTALVGRELAGNLGERLLRLGPGLLHGRCWGGEGGSGVSLQKWRPDKPVGVLLAQVVQIASRPGTAHVEPTVGGKRQAVAVNDIGVGVADETVQRRHVHAGEVGVGAEEGGITVALDAGDEHAAGAAGGVLSGSSSGMVMTAISSTTGSGVKNCPA